MSLRSEESEAYKEGNERTKMEMKEKALSTKRKVRRRVGQGMIMMMISAEERSERDISCLIISSLNNLTNG